MAAAAIFNFEKLLPLLYYWTNPRQIWWKCRESYMKRNCFVKDAYLPKVKMAAATILYFEKLWLFLYYWTNPHQI